MTDSEDLRDIRKRQARLVRAFRIDARVDRGERRGSRYYWNAFANVSAVDDPAIYAEGSDLRTSQYPDVAAKRAVAEAISKLLRGER